jgi:acetolactate synthase-1/2/3 large subunit
LFEFRIAAGNSPSLYIHLNFHYHIYMQLTGSQILIECLIEQGVDTVFGYPGGTVLFIYDELYKNSDRITHVLTSHEQHAAHAADGYARSTGKVGVCIATSGPGATNLVTGIATAYMDSVPLVAITGNVATALLGKDSFQEVDIAGVTMPIVKHNWIVKDIGELAEILREAFIVAKTGRPGPVLVDIPKDITQISTEFTPKSKNSAENDGILDSPRAKRLLERSKKITYTETDIEKALILINEAKRPFIYAGGGVISANAAAEVANLAEKLQSPIGLSLMAQGVLPFDHPLYTGMIGMHGTAASNKAVQNTDLLLAIGARFSDRVTSSVANFAKNAKILQFDIDSAEINKNIMSCFAVNGDIKEIVTKILKKLPQKENPAWKKQLDEWKTIKPKQKNAGGVLHARFIIESVAAKLGKDAIVVTDVGQHQMWTAQFYPFERPRQLITSGGLGTMGFGLGAALGAQKANPGKKVVLFVGDGGFRMNCAEMGTLVAYGLPVLIVVINNTVLGMVRQWQTLFYGKRYSETVLDRPPDFVKLAGAYGIASWSAASEEAFEAVLDKAASALEAGKPSLIEALIDKDEMVLPMVPGGKPIDEQIL